MPFDFVLTTDEGNEVEVEVMDGETVAVLDLFNSDRDYAATDLTEVQLRSLAIALNMAADELKERSDAAR